MGYMLAGHTPEERAEFLRKGRALTPPARTLYRVTCTDPSNVRAVCAAQRAALQAAGPDTCCAVSNATGAVCLRPHPHPGDHWTDE